MLFLRYIPMLWLFSFRGWDTNLSNFLTSAILEGTGFSVKIGSFKFRCCTYWLKWELVYFVMLSGRIHLNWSSWFKMVNLFEGCWFSILSNLSLSLPLRRKAPCFFFPAFSFLFTLKFLVATWARRRRTTTRGGRSWTLHLLLLTIFFTKFFTPSILVIFLWYISYLYLITVVGFSFSISHSFGSAGLAPSSSRGENQKRTERARN